MLLDLMLNIKLIGFCVDDSVLRLFMILGIENMVLLCISKWIYGKCWCMWVIKCLRRLKV